jgi:hypothetical protein
MIPLGVACDRSCICVLVESLWPVIGHVFVCLLNRCGLWSVMYLCTCWTVQRFKKHTNTWPITGNNDSTSTQTHDRSEAATIQQAHKVCLLNRCGLSSVMYLFACWIVVASDRSCVCVLVESLWPVNGHVFNDSTSTQIHDRSQATIPLADKCMTDHRPQRLH